MIVTDRTILSYRKHAAEAIGNWVKARKRSGVPPFLRMVLRKICRPVMAQKGRMRVLDVGCGPGLDSVEFARVGCDGVGLDAVPEFLDYAGRQARSGRVLEKIKFVRADMSRLGAGSPFLVSKSFNLLWANASLIHIRKKELPEVLGRLLGMLMGGGVMAATFFHGKGEGVYPGSFVPGRFFARYLKKELHQKFARGGWKVQSIRTVANEARKGRWLNVTATPA